MANKNNQLIESAIEFKPILLNQDGSTNSLLEESAKNKIYNTKNLIVSGKISAADIKNGNNRIYPFSILNREIQNYIKTKINKRKALGELDHPTDSIIMLQNVSHRILKTWWVDNSEPKPHKDLYADIEILPTPSGNILKNLFLSNVNVGISSRGLGSLDDKGIVQDDFHLICFDFVSDPSAFGAEPKMESSDTSAVPPVDNNSNNIISKKTTDVKENTSLSTNSASTEFKTLSALISEALCTISKVCNI